MIVVNIKVTSENNKLLTTVDFKDTGLGLLKQLEVKYLHFHKTQNTESQRLRFTFHHRKLVFIPGSCASNLFLGDILTRKSNSKNLWRKSFFHLFFDPLCSSTSLHPSQIKFKVKPFHQPFHSELKAQTREKKKKGHEERTEATNGQSGHSWRKCLKDIRASTKTALSDKRL